MIGRNRRLKNRMEHDSQETLPLVQMLGGFAVDACKALLDWNKPDDVEWPEFLMTKAGALVLVLVCLVGLLAIIGFLLLKYQHLAGG